MHSKDAIPKQQLSKRSSEDEISYCLKQFYLRIWQLKSVLNLNIQFWLMVHETFVYIPAE